MSVKMAKVTIRDVAKEAGVSIATVSNALNDVDVLNPDTKKRVMEAVDKLRYVPNLNGRYLKAGSSKMIGFFTNNISGPYFGGLLDAMGRQCDRLGYGMNVFITRNPQVIMGNIMGKRIDGVIIFEDTMIKDQQITQMEEEKIKAVFLDREIQKKQMSSVLFNSYQMGYEAAKYLINLGHRKISFIESVDDVFDSCERKRGYMDALKEHGIQVDKELILQGAFEEEYTYNTMKMFVRYHADKMPEAFLAGNDLSAIGCIKLLIAEGYRIPEDVSVMGFDDIDIAQYFSPPLTTVKNPIARQGMEAVDTLIKLIEGKQEGSISRLIGNLVVRNSCKLRSEP